MRLQQFVKMDDEIAHLGVVHGRLRRAPPGVEGSLVVGINPHELDLGQVLELRGVRRHQFTAEHDVAGTPVAAGSARAFATTYSNYGDERYDVPFGEDTTATNFFYDGWVYLASPSSDIANLEMDLNQVMANGQTVIFGFQCDGYSGTWDYTENTGTPEAPVDQWVHTSASCNPRNWQTDTWHHVQISFARDDAGNVTYNAVWLDGNEQGLNVTVPSSFALGWSPTLLTNFQVDGLGSGGSSTAYLDNLIVYRW